MQCPRCGAPCGEGDNFCARCGAELATRLPARVDLPRWPARWGPLRGVVLRGAAALLVGTAAELARRQIRRHLSPAALADQVEGLLRRGAERRAPVRVPVRVVKRAEETVAPAQEAQVTVYRAAFFQRIRILRR